jgi:RNA recognition motif-containing protein
MATDPEESTGDGEEIRTLFVSGLPYDVTEREIRHCFRNCDGFDFVSVRTNQKSPVAFVGFSDHAAALRARDSIQGYQMDPNVSTKVSADLAKTNSRKRFHPSTTEHPEKRAHVFSPGGGTPFSYGLDGITGSLRHGGSAHAYGSTGHSPWGSS